MSKKLNKKQQVEKVIAETDTTKLSINSIAKDIGLEKKYTSYIVRGMGYRFQSYKETADNWIFNSKPSAHPQPEEDTSYLNETTDIPDNAPKTKMTVTGNIAEVDVTSTAVHTLEQALELAAVDLEIWQVDKWVTNSWNVTMKGPDSNPILRTNWQTKVWLKAKVAISLREGLIQFASTMPTLKLPAFKKKNPHTKETALELGLNDVHFGMLAYGKETGMGDYDLDIAEKNFTETTERLLNQGTKYTWPSKIMFPIGNDYFHVENLANETPKGKNRLDADSRLPKIIDTGLRAMLKSIRMCLDIAPVELILVPGNHDEVSSYWLATVLEHAFSNNEYVTVDSDPVARKARLWGNLLVGFMHHAHGVKELRGVNYLAQMHPELWGKSMWREIHVGHMHKKGTVKYTPFQSVGGVQIRTVPSLATIDAWHADSGFADQVPAGEAYVWTKNDGITATFTAPIKFEGRHF